MNKKILLVGTVSNVAKTIEKELRVVLKALSVFDFVEVFLVESDSTDETVKILKKIASNNNSFLLFA
jgi:glycosyltransferase involved in cell wall biosynthesis